MSWYEVIIFTTVIGLVAGGGAGLAVGLFALVVGK